MEISSVSDILLQYSKAVNLATGGKQSVPFGHDVDNLKSAQSVNNTQKLQEQTEHFNQENRKEFDAQTQTSMNLKKANYYNEKKGQNVDIFV